MQGRSVQSVQRFGGEPAVTRLDRHLPRPEPPEPTPPGESSRSVRVFPRAGRWRSAGRPAGRSHDFTRVSLFLHFPLDKFQEALPRAVADRLQRTRVRHAGRQQASPPRWFSSSEGPPRGARQTRPREVAKRSPILSSWNALTRSGRSPTTIFSIACRISSVSAVATRPTSSLTLARSTGAGSTPAKLGHRCSRGAPTSSTSPRPRPISASPPPAPRGSIPPADPARRWAAAPHGHREAGAHLTPENREALLERAAHRTRREIEELVAELAPRPDAPAVMRKLPDRRAEPASPALRIGTNAEVPSLRLRPDGVAAREPELLPDESRRPGSNRVRPERQCCRPLPVAGPR